MNEFVANFHFVRPFWLLLIPLVALVTNCRVRRRRTAGWSKHIANDKLAYLAVGSAQTSVYQWILLVPLLLICLALAGPSFQSIPTSGASNRQAMVILFDLSPSMLAEDIKPNRLERASLKLFDLLHMRTTGETALVVYAGDAYRVAPLTDDPAIIKALIPTLHPSIMPIPGSQPERALSLALSLFDGAGLTQGDIVLVTDGVHPRAIDSIKQIVPRGYRLSILGIGTTEGAPIPMNSAAYLRDADEQIIIASLDDAPLQELAEHFSGRYRRIASDNSDVEHLSSISSLPFSAKIRHDLQTFDSSHDAGYWLVLLLLPVAACLFRRNLIFAFLPVMFFPADSHAWSWTDLWLTPDQQAQIALQEGRAELAAELFEQPSWIAVARYRNEEYTDAAKLFARGQGADDYYNLANAQALSGDIESALASYDKALALFPEHVDALYNREFLQAVLRQRNEPEDDTTEEQNQRNTGTGESDSQSEDNETSEEAASNSEQKNIGGNAGAGQTLNQQARQDAGQSNSSTADGERLNETSEDATPVEIPGAITNRELDDGIIADSGALQIEDSESTVLNPYSEQWLRSLPKDPGGYLRRKFQYQAQIREQENGGDTPSLIDGRY